MIKNLLMVISNSDALYFHEILNAAVKRYQELFPDWAISVLTLHKHIDRNEQIDSVIALLQQ